MNCVRWISILVFPLVATSAIGAEKAFLQSENQLLETELSIAAAPRIYFIFDFQDKKVYLKARGRVLRELAIKGIRSWGKVSVARATTLVEKSTLFPPKRGLITPSGNKEGDEVRVETLELKDMPASFTLVMERETWITVRPEPTGMISWLWSVHYPFKWYLTRPVLTVWHALRKKSFTSIEIVLKADDARSLYWSFFEGMAAIVYSPGHP
jgi:hypothetical protein